MVPFFEDISFVTIASSDFQVNVLWQIHLLYCFKVSHGVNVGFFVVGHLWEYKIKNSQSSHDCSACPSVKSHQYKPRGNVELTVYPHLRECPLEKKLARVPVSVKSQETVYHKKVNNCVEFSIKIQFKLVILKVN